MLWAPGLHCFSVRSKLRGESGKGEGGSVRRIFSASPLSPRVPTTPPCGLVGGVAGAGDGAAVSAHLISGMGKRKEGDERANKWAPFLQGYKCLLMFFSVLETKTHKYGLHHTISKNVMCYAQNYPLRVCHRPISQKNKAYRPLSLSSQTILKSFPT
jgi:hypothetical protein